MRTHIGITIREKLISRRIETIVLRGMKQEHRNLILKSEENTAQGLVRIRVVGS